MKGTREALTVTTGWTIALYLYQHLMPPVLSLRAFTDEKGGDLSEVSPEPAGQSQAALDHQLFTFFLLCFVIFFHWGCAVQRQQGSLLHDLGQLASLIVTCSTKP